MKRIIPLLGLALFSLPGLAAADLTTAEIVRAEEQLAASGAAFLASIDGLSAEQLNFKSDPTRWSVAEVAEHLAAAEGFLMNLITGQVMVAPARAAEVNLGELDEMVLTGVADRTNKVQAPEPLAPSNRFGSVESSRSVFVEGRAGTVAYLQNTKGLRDHAIDSPLGAQLDGYQWLLFISAHTVRHTKQIEEVKAHPDFPKA